MCIPEVPATPIIYPNQLIVMLPIPTVPTPQRNPTPIPPSLFSRLTTPQHQREGSLQYKIQPHANLYQLHKQLAQGKKILLVSNTSVNHKGHGTLAWIIHVEKTLWSGKGISPGPTSKMYSVLAEVYRVYTALSFLVQYEATFPIMYHKRPWVFVCCDNTGVIEWLNQESYRTKN